MNHETVTKDIAKRNNKAREVDPVDLICVVVNRPSLVWSPVCERHGYRPPTGPGESCRRLRLVAATIVHVDELAEFCDHKTWEMWLAQGMVEVRAATDEDTLMLSDVGDSIELAFAENDHMQLVTWLRNEWHPKVREVLTRRVEATADDYLRQQAASQNRATADALRSAWSNR